VKFAPQLAQEKILSF